MILLPERPYSTQEEYSLIQQSEKRFTERDRLGITAPPYSNDVNTLEKESLFEGFSPLWLTLYTNNFKIKL